MQIKNPATTFCDACSVAIAYEKARLMVMAPSRERDILVVLCPVCEVGMREWLHGEGWVG